MQRVVRCDLQKLWHEDHLQESDVIKFIGLNILYSRQNMTKDWAEQNRYA